MENTDQKREASTRQTLVSSEQGAIGYILAWLLGVPASVLFVIFILRGCN